MNPYPEARSRFRRESALGPVLLLLLIASGCEDDTSFTQLQSRMQLNPPPPTRLEFEEQVLGRGVAEPIVIRVTSVGTGELVVGPLSFRGDAAEMFRISSAPDRLRPGQSGTIFVRYEPTTAESHEATLVIRSSDPSQREVTYPVFGRTRNPCTISAEPRYQPFLLGEQREFTLSNDSDSDCRIIRLATDRSLFRFVPEPELPIDLGARERLVLTMEHHGISTQPGLPVREIRIKEIEGTETVATVSGEEPVFGCLELFPDTLLFAPSDVNERPRRSVRISNRCAESAAVTSVALAEGFNFFEVNRDAFPATVAGGESVDIDVTYVPFSSAGDLGRMLINTTDAARPRFEVQLFGQATESDLEVFPRSLDFGTVVFQNPRGATQRSECSSTSQSVKVHSTGSAPLLIQNLRVEDSSDDEFLVVSVLNDGAPVLDFSENIVVAAGGQLEVFIQFFPTRAKPSDHRGRLIIEHNAEERQFEVDLSGRGQAAGQVEDEFEQLAGPKVDILWVIDDSCSMGDEQARLISNLSQFVGYADSLSADYQMGVTVTDSRSPDAGKLRRCFPHPAIIRSDYGEGEPDPQAVREAAFQCTFSVGTGGGFNEAGLGAAMRALQRATNPTLSPNINAGFLRDDAKLAVVVMSDEDDQTLLTEAVLLDFFNTIKGRGRADQVSVHAIAGPVNEVCPREGRFSAFPGFRYDSMADLTGGQFFNICLNDWQPILQNLGLGVFTPLDSWELSQAADPGTIVVTVADVPVPPSLTNGWSYDTVGNLIRFNGDALPPPGAAITVDYEGLCRP